MPQTHMRCPVTDTLFFFSAFQFFWQEIYRNDVVIGFVHFREAYKEATLRNDSTIIGNGFSMLYIACLFCFSVLILPSTTLLRT